MATQLNRLEFKQCYPGYSQGLFILLSKRRIPRGQDEVNVGQQLSSVLCDIQKSEREDQVTRVLTNTLSTYRAVSLIHLEILFTPSLKLDVIRTLLSLCRNRKICLVWPGTMLDGKLLYATPNRPEYYECDLRSLQDTYIVTE